MSVELEQATLLRVEVGDASTATLMRLVAVLHGRGADVRALSWARDADGARLVAEVLPGVLGGDRLLDVLLNCVDVKAVERCENAPHLLLTL